MFDENDGVVESKIWAPSIKPKYTPKGCFHRVVGLKTTWALCIRGSWDKTWKEHKNGDTYTLTHGRVKL